MKLWEIKKIYCNTYANDKIYLQSVMIVSNQIMAHFTYLVKYQGNSKAACS